MNIDWNQIIEKLKLDMTSLIIDVISIAVIFLLARITLGMLIRFTSQVIKRAEKMEENRQTLNQIIPSYARVHAIHQMPEEFEKTPKKSIKRYIYTNYPV